MKIDTMRERSLEDDELSTLSVLTELPKKELVKELEIAASSCLLKPIISYSELSDHIKPLYDGLFHIHGIDRNSDIEDVLSSLKQKHYYESTAFVALFNMVRETQVVPPFPPTKANNKFGVDIWQSAHSKRVTPLTAAILEHHQFELFLNEPCRLPQVKQSKEFLSRCFEVNQEHEAQLSSLGKKPLDPLRNTFKFGSSSS